LINIRIFWFFFSITRLSKSLNKLLATNSWNSEVIIMIISIVINYTSKRWLNLYTIDTFNVIGRLIAETVAVKMLVSTSSSFDYYTAIDYNKCINNKYNIWSSWFYKHNKLYYIDIHMLWWRCIKTFKILLVLNGSKYCVYKHYKLPACNINYYV